MHRYLVSCQRKITAASTTANSNSHIIQWYASTPWITIHMGSETKASCEAQPQDNKKIMDIYYCTAFQLIQPSCVIRPVLLAEFCHLPWVTAPWPKTFGKSKKPSKKAFLKSIYSCGLLWQFNQFVSHASQGVWNRRNSDGSQVTGASDEMSRSVEKLSSFPLKINCFSSWRLSSN